MNEHVENFVEKIDTIQTMYRQVTIACEIALHEYIMKYNPRITEQNVDNFKVVGWDVMKFVDPSKSYVHVQYVSKYWDGFRTEHLDMDTVKKFIPNWDTGFELVEKK